MPSKFDILACAVSVWGTREIGRGLLPDARLQFELKIFDQHTFRGGMHEYSKAVDLILSKVRVLSLIWQAQPERHVPRNFSNHY